MNYQETIEYLYQQLPMYQRIGPKAFKKDLTNTLKLLAHLGNPEKRFPAIHIAGTNGKGSTAHILSALLQAKGLKTGLYTSPHYLDFRERIKINGQYITQQAVIDFVQQNKSIFAEIQPSFFEITVALAFHYFAVEKVDIAVIETGLGGEFDSTNVITPILSVITNIGYDHQDMLGETLAEIAHAKAGIIKPGVPVVIGETHPESKAVFIEKARLEKAPIYFADQAFSIIPIENSLEHTYYQVLKDRQLIHPNLKINLQGAYQKYNLQTVFQAIECLPAPFKPTDQEKEYAFSHIKALTNFAGRWQVISRKPMIVMDSAHNINGIEQVIDQLTTIPYDQLHIILGMVKEKDHQKILRLFPRNASYYFVKPDLPRGLDAVQLQAKASLEGLEGAAYPSVGAALDEAKSNAGEDDLIFIGGSNFVVADVMKIMGDDVLPIIS